jgi:hypothetical protein
MKTDYGNTIICHVFFALIRSIKAFIQVEVVLVKRLSVQQLNRGELGAVSLFN